MDANKITQIVASLVEKIKEAKGYDYHNAKWGEHYVKSCKHADEIEAHACGESPEKLIGSKSSQMKATKKKNIRENHFNLLQSRIGKRR